MSAPMVKAILAGRKTQTRRAVKPQPEEVWPADGVNLSGPNGPVHYEAHHAKANFIDGSLSYGASGFCTYSKGWRCPYGQPDDRLWVRETGWERPERTPKMMREGADTWERYYYDADGLSDADAEDFKQWGFKRRPSIFMPRWASRITLEIMGVRVERLQDISKTDCIAEGMEGLEDVHAGWHQSYAQLFDSINGKGSWDANPWVWVIEFKPAMSTQRAKSMGIEERGG